MKFNFYRRRLLDTFDDETLNRYEAFRRAHLPKAHMRKLISQMVGPVPASVAIGTDNNLL